jgi:hypothetical protein
MARKMTWNEYVQKNILGEITHRPTSRSIENNCINSIPYIPMCKTFPTPLFMAAKVQMDMK